MMLLLNHVQDVSDDALLSMHLICTTSRHHSSEYLGTVLTLPIFVVLSIHIHEIANLLQ